MSDRIKNIASLIRNRTNGFQPETGIILGSGLGSFAENVQAAYTIPYREIEGFPVSTVAGHAGLLILGEIANRKVIVLQGRFHYYEGYSPAEVVLPIRVMKLLGIKTLMISNAAGAINPAYHPGDLMLIKDHINLIPNPLIGQNIDSLSPRFPDMTDAYSPVLREKAKEIARKQEILLHEGCYLGTTGPSYETPAEIGYFKLIGADAVGMSTTPEVIAARHAGIDVFAVSVITNTVSAEKAQKASHQEVIEEGHKAQAKMTALFIDMLK